MRCVTRMRSGLRFTRPRHRRWRACDAICRQLQEDNDEATHPDIRGAGGKTPAEHLKRESIMEFATVNLPQDDALRYKVYVSRAVPRADITISVVITLLVPSSENTPEQINQRVNAALNDFISGDWQFVGTSRSAVTPGYEKVAINAVAKVPADDYRNLQERARKAARDGLEFGQVNVKRALPEEQVNQVVTELWFETVALVDGHIAEFAKRSNRHWRIGEIVFGVPASGKRHSEQLGKGAYREDLDEVLGKLIESGLAGAEKISLIADVTLRSARPA